MDAAPAAYTSTDGEALADVLNQIAANGDYTNFEKGVYYAAKELDTLAGQANLITVGFPYYSQDERLDPLTTLAGGFVGGKLFGKVSAPWLRRIFGVFLVYGGVRYLL